MVRFLLDTNICIYIAKRHPPEVARRFARASAGSLGMSFITYGELRYGAEKSAKRKENLSTLDRLVELVPVIGPTAEIGETYGAIRAHLERLGRAIGNNDLWIAAHALMLGVTLVTNNIAEFERVPKLKLQNWVE